MTYKDATDTEVDEEIFSDLLRQGNVVLTVFCSDGEISKQIKSTVIQILPKNVTDVYCLSSEYSEWSSASDSDSSFNSNASTSTILMDEIPRKKQKTENANNSVSAKNVTIFFDCL